MTPTKVLIGCEFGDNRGHVARCVEIANALTLRGLSVVLAVPIRFARSLPQTVIFDIELMSDWGGGGSVEHRYGSGGTNSMGDVLVQLGFRLAGRVEAAVTRWTKILAQHKPAIVIADYAPNLLSAARGRLPAVSIGTGFTCPPPTYRTFRALSGKEAKYDEAVTLRIVNAELRAAGAKPIEALPALFGCDVEIVGTFRELDPYARQRWSCPYSLPSMSKELAEAPGPKGEEIFVYSYNGVAPESAFWTALKAPGYPVRLYMQAPTASHIELFARSGFKLEREPIGFDLVAKRSRMVLSHGGHGIIASSLMSGLPMVMACFDLEKYLNGSAMMQARAGKALWIRGSKAIEMAEAIDEVWQEAKYAKAAVDLSQRICSRRQLRMKDSVFAVISRENS